MPWGAVAGAVASGVVGSVLSDGGSGGGGGASAGQERLANTQADLALKDRANYDEIYLPLERSLVDQAGKTNSPEEIARVEGEANADVTGSFNRARLEDIERMRAQGINPASPAFQSSQGSVGIAEAATRAGALKTARDTLRDTGYARQFALANLGRGIPSQVSAGLSSAGNQLSNIAARADMVSQRDKQNTAYALAPIGNAVNKYVSSKWNDWTSSGSKPLNGTGGISGSTDPNSDYGTSAGAGDDWFAKGGRVKPKDHARLRRRAAHHLARHLLKHYADGGRVGDDKWDRLETSGGRYYDHEGADGTGAQYSGSTVTLGNERDSDSRESERMPHDKAVRLLDAVRRAPKVRMASGGNVDVSEVGQLKGPGTQTSDSIPAVIDGNRKAALSTDEFVMNAGVSKLSALEILDAINKRGLAKRGDAPAANDDDLGQEDQPAPVTLEQAGMKRGGKVSARGAC